MNKKWMYTLIGIIAVLTIGLSAYIVYDKMNAKEPVRDQETKKEQNNSKEPNIKIDNDTQIVTFPKNDSTSSIYYTIGYKKNVCKNNDANCKFIDSSTDFKTTKIDTDGISIETSCSKFITEEHESYCQESKMRIDGKIDYDPVLGYEPRKSKIIIAKTRDYYIIQDLDAFLNGKITIYDKSGNLVKTIEEVSAAFAYGDIYAAETHQRHENFEIVLNDGKLYFMTSDNYKDYLENPDKYIKDNLCKTYVRFKYMDLKDLEIKEISKSCGYTTSMLP